MSSAKTSSGLGPLVECSEGFDPEEQAENGEGSPPVEQPKSHDEGRSRVRETPSKTSDGIGRRKKTGSRLSLVSLFSFTSGGAAARERSRSGWSYGEDGAGAVTMSSVSASDIRAAVASSISNSKRYRGSDAGSCAHGSSDNCIDSLLAADDENADDVADEDKKKGTKKGVKTRECPLCCMRQPIANFPRLYGCHHRSCRLCLMQYVEMEIMENRVEVSCPECASYLHPADIRLLVGGRSGLIEKYEQFSVRRYLLSETDARWCPAPDCGYAVIAASCAACPQLKCEREKCGMLFCYHCKREWHANQTCDEARRSRCGGKGSRGARRAASADSLEAQLKPGDVKSCPRCRTFIVKMDDGSCNHMVCAMCSAEFCWLCLKEISDLHYLSPTGCTFWGKKPWTRKKKLLWQLGTLVGAPVGIALIAGLSIPGIIFGVPVFIGRKVHQRFIHHSKLRRRLVTAACVVGAFCISPVLAVMAVGVGVPIMLAYVYGVVPLSLCRNGGCGLSRSGSQNQLDSLEEEQLWSGPPGADFSQVLLDERLHTEGETTEAETTNSINSGLSGTDTRPHPSRLVVFTDANRRRTSVESAGVNSMGEKLNYEDASVKAMAGSHYYDDKSVNTIYSCHEAFSYTDEIASTKALSGSVVDTKSLSESVGARRHVLARYAEKNEVSGDECVYLAVAQGSSDDDKSEDHAGCSSSSSGSARNKSQRPTNSDADEHYYYPDTSVLETLGSRTAHAGPSVAETEHDPFKIRALFDNMKQMVAADVHQEKPYELSQLRVATGQLRRSNSGKSMSALGTVTASPVAASNISMPATGTADTVSIAASTSSKRRRRLGFFTSLFGRKK